MSSQSDNPGSRKWTPPEDRALVDVNLDEKDAAKAIERRQDSSLPPPEDAPDDPEARFLDRSRAVKKRIARIQRQFDQRIAERDAEHQREISALRDEFNGLKARKAEAPAVDDAAHERAISALQAELSAAHEAGESKKVAELTARINRLEGEYWHRKTVAQLGAKEPEQKPAQRVAPRQEVPAGPTGEAKRWMRANTDWWDDEDFAGEKAYANAIFAKLVDDEEMDPDDPETFQELSKRVRKRFKDLDIVDPDAKRQKRGKVRDDDDEDDLEVGTLKRAPSPVMQVDRGNAPTVRRGRGVTLTAADTAAMKQFGLDPDNDKHVLRWAAEKQATEEA